jgi:hypothetical protein
MQPEVLALGYVLEAPQMDSRQLIDENLEIPPLLYSNHHHFTSKPF